MSPTIAQHVTAIIPHWNRRTLLEQLLRNLQQQTRVFDRILVVDNGSTDGSPELAESLGATVLRLDRNYGFAAAVNRGVEAARRDTSAQLSYVAILNNDVTLDPRWLETLLEAIDHPAQGRHWFATGLILSAAPGILGETIDGTWDEVSRAACAVRCGAGQQLSPLWQRSRPIRMASMTALLLRAELFVAVGKLDERFGSYLEDVDFGLRCAQAGFGGVYQPSAVAYHQGSATLGAWNPASVRLISRNQVLLAAKHFLGRRLWPHMVVRLLWGQGLWGLLALKHQCGWAYLQGKLAGFRMVGEMRTGGEAAANVAEVVVDSERQIFDIQQRAGFDLYWRLYFLFGRPARAHERAES